MNHAGYRAPSIHFISKNFTHNFKKNQSRVKKRLTNEIIKARIICWADIGKEAWVFINLETVASIFSANKERAGNWKKCKNNLNNGKVENAKGDDKSVVKLTCNPGKNKPRSTTKTWALSIHMFPKKTLNDQLDPDLWSFSRIRRGFDCNTRTVLRQNHLCRFKIHSTGPMSKRKRWT